MRNWSFSAYGRTYEITDYGPRVGIQVTRDGYTVWTGYRDGSRLVTDTSTLPSHELLAVRAEILDLPLVGTLAHEAAARASLGPLFDRHEAARRP